MELDNHSFTLENNFLLEKTKKTLPRKSMSKLIDETLHYLNIFHVCALLFEFLTAAGTEVSSSCWWHLYFKIQLMIRWNNAWPANVPKKHLHDSEAHEDWVASKLNQVNHHNWFWWIKNELVVKLKNKRVLQIQFWAKTFWKWYFGGGDIFSISSKISLTTLFSWYFNQYFLLSDSKKWKDLQPSYTLWAKIRRPRQLK